MKILFYINTINHGGAERVLTNLAGFFSANGYECIFVTSFYSEREYELFDRIDRISLFENKPNGNYFKRNVLLTMRLRELIKKERPDVIVSFMAEPNFRMLIASLGIQAKKIISIRNDPQKEYPNLLFKFLAKTIYTFADGVVFQTEDARKWFPRIIQRKSKIILNPVAPIFYTTQYHGIRKNIVSVGRLVSQKNHRLLIEAFAKIAEEIDDNLYIYGEGNLRFELETLINEMGLKKRVFLPGIVDDVANTIKTAKLFVLSSDYEGMPNALMEAMALGIPVISTDCPCGGPQMLLNDIEEDLLVDVNNSEQLSNIMKKVLTSTQTLQKIELQVKAKAEIFSYERIFEDWQVYIEKCVKQR